MWVLGLIVGAIAGWIGGYWWRNDIANRDAAHRESINPSTPYLHLKTGLLWRRWVRAVAHDSNAEMWVLSETRANMPTVFPEPVFRAEFEEMSEADVMAYRRPPGR